MYKPKHIQVTIPTPCHEDWDKMTPQQQGRFCDSCQKCVADFTQLTDEQLCRFLQEHKEEKICGRFYGTQLNRKIFVPQSSYSKYQWFLNLGLVAFLAGWPNKKSHAQQVTGDTVLTDNNISAYYHTNIEGNISTLKDKRIGNAYIVLLDNGKVLHRTSTNKYGNFNVPLKKGGSYTLVARKQGYKTTTINNINVNTKETTYMTIGLRETNGADSIQVVAFTAPTYRNITREEAAKKLYVGHINVSGTSHSYYLVNNPKKPSIGGWFRKIWRDIKGVFSKRNETDCH